MKKLLTLVVIFLLLLSTFSILTPQVKAGDPISPNLSLTIPGTARVVDYDDGIYVVGTSDGELHVINEAGEYTVTQLGTDYFINDVRIENSLVVVAANHYYESGEYYWDGYYYRYVYFDGGYVIKFVVLEGLNPAELWRTYVAGWGYWYEGRWNGTARYESLPVAAVDISSDGSYIAYLSRSSVGVLNGDDGTSIASCSIAGAYIVCWLDATDDIEYIAITAEVGPPEADYGGVNTGVELYRFNHATGTLTKQWGRILIYNYETTEVRVSEAKDYVAVATSSGTFMNLLSLSTGEVLWQYETPGKEQFACDGDDNLNYVIGGTQAWSSPYSWFILRNLGTSYEIVAEGEMVGPVNDLDSTPDASYFAFGSDAGEFILLKRSNDAIDTIFVGNVGRLIDAIEIGKSTLLVGGDQFINLYIIKPDLTISEIKPVQVIWDCDINDDGWVDLVQGKATAVAVYIDGFQILSDDKILEVDLNFEGKINSTRITIGGLKEAKGVIIFHVHAPQYIGHQVVIAEVDPRNYIEESNEENNVKRQIITVKDTRGLNIIYFPVEHPEYKPPDVRAYPVGYKDSIEKSVEFIQATYPISESEFNYDPRNEPIKGSTIKFVGIALDCRMIAKEAKRLSAGRGIGIGIVPHGYFEYHGVGWAGKSWPSVLGGIVVEDDYWTTVAHEIGHAYGLRFPIEEYWINPPGNRADGFWVVKNQDIENRICFMGEAQSVATLDDEWICDDCYKDLFKKFREDKKDPEILVVDGMVYKDGMIELGKWYKIEEGEDDLEEIIPGDYSLQILDKNGNILQQISFSVEFWVSVNSQIIETDFAPFTFAVPYPENASTLKILHKEEVIVEINLSVKLINDAMDSLYSDYNVLMKTVEKSDIQQGIKNSLTSKITNARKKAEEGIAYIREGRDAQGKNMLNSASNIIEAFINEVNAQKGKKILEKDANGFISWAQKMILTLQNQIVNSL